MFTDPVAAGHRSAVVNNRIGNSRFGWQLFHARRRVNTAPASKARLYKTALRVKLGIPLNTPIKTEAWRTWDGDPNSIVVPEDWNRVSEGPA